jgi:glutathione peroxidase
MRLIISLLGFITGSTILFHSLSTSASNGSAISFAAFEGKNVLIVNTATNSPDTAQFAQLEELYQQYKGQLLVIAVPSNDFGNEPLSDNDINTTVAEKYQIHFLLAGKQGVKDSSSISSLYDWLTHKTKNGMADSRVKGDFYKYLINGSGQIIGIYSNKVLPMDDAIRNAIK